MKRIFSFISTGCLVIAHYGSLPAQDLNFPGTAPSVSITIHVKKGDLNFLAASKTKNGFHTVKGIDYEPGLLEIYTQALYSYRLSENWQIATGYGFQRNNPFQNNWRNEHRLVQQVVFTVHGHRFKFNNRFRFEERWFSFPDAAARFNTRARYQAGIVKQFNDEIYWQLNNEIYATTSGSRYSWITENWLYSGIGFPVRSLGHFETGLGYNSVIRNAEKNWYNLILLQVNWSFIIPPAMKKKMHPALHSRHF